MAARSLGVLPAALIARDGSTHSVVNKDARQAAEMALERLARDHQHPLARASAAHDTSCDSNARHALEFDLSARRAVGRPDCA